MAICSVAHYRLFPAHDYLEGGLIMDGALMLIQMLNGLQLGVLLFLLAAGLTLVFGIMDFINLAHGAFYMLGAFICATLAIWFDSFLIAVLLSVPITFAIGVVVELGVARQLYQADHLEQILATFGLILIADTLVQMIWGPEGMTFALPEVLNGQVQLLYGVEFPVYRVLIISVGLLVALALYLVVSHTRTGMLIRAGASNRRMVEALGVDIRMLFTLVFAAGAAMAGLAGLMIAPITEASIGMGNEILIVAFVVIVIGGIGSVQGAFFGAMLVGLIDTLGRAFLDDLLGLVLVPSGCGNVGAGHFSDADLYLNGRYFVFSPARSFWGTRLMTLRSGGWCAGVALLGALLLPVWVVYAREPFVLDVVTRLMILAIAASSLNLILGYSGMVSLGHAVFLGIGAYAAGIPAYYELNNGWLQLAAALGASGIFALLTGLVCLRTRGAYFIMITLAFAQMMYFIFVSIEEYGGDDGLVIYSRSEMGFGVDLNDNVQLYFLVLFCLAAVLGFMHRLTQSDFGQVIRSIKINEVRVCRHLDLQPSSIGWCATLSQAWSAASPAGCWVISLDLSVQR